VSEPADPLLPRLGDSTRLVHQGRRRPEPKALVNPPLERGSTLLFHDPDAIYKKGLGEVYGRMGLSVQRALEAGLCDLEQADHVFLAPSGLAACTMPLLAVLRPGDHLCVVDCVYGPTRRFAETTLAAMNVEVTFVEADLNGASLARALRPNTRAVLLESPGSLTFEMQDLPAIVDMCRPRNIITLIDNTWAGGHVCKPLTLGLDVSMQSLTKYVIGGSDWFGGSIACKSGPIAEAIDAFMVNLGVNLGPEEAYSAQRGLRSMALRMQTQAATSLELAAYLSTQPEVATVLHPAWPDHPQHHYWKASFRGASGLFSIHLKPMPPASVSAFMHGFRLFGHGFSWGGFESLIIQCDQQLKRSVSKPPAGSLLRLHAGLETPEDLIADLEAAFIRLRASL